MAVILPKISLGGAPALAGVPAATDWVAPGLASSALSNLLGAPTIAIPITVTALKLVYSLSIGFKARVLFTSMSYTSGEHAADVFTLADAGAAAISEALGTATPGAQVYSGVAIGSNQVVAAGEALTLTVTDGGNNPAGVYVIYVISEP